MPRSRGPGPLAANAAVEDLFVWSSREGLCCLAAASEGGAVYIWDPELGAALGAPLTIGARGVWASAGRILRRLVGTSARWREA